MLLILVIIIFLFCTSLQTTEQIIGGWAPVPKSNPKLWSKILSGVKREPGPWAAWKAIKADKLYKEAGGHFL